MNVSSAIVGGIAVLMCSCVTNDNKSIEGREVLSPECNYEIQWFTYPDSTALRRYNLCTVKYYVNGDTLFTSEKYHFLSLSYSYDNDNSMAYQHIIFFDKKQNADKDGWYHITLNRDSIPREPDTHISGIVLRAYIGEMYDYKHMPHANAYLFNSTIEVPNASDRNALSPELKKLYNVIK